MTMQIKGKFVKDSTLDGDKIKLNWDSVNNSTQAIRAFDENGNEIEVIKVEHTFDLDGNLTGTKTFSDGEELAKQSILQTLQNEVDAVESGAGLDTDGTYIVDTVAEYISTATSLADADTKLDAAIKNIWDQRNQDNGFAGLDENGLIDPIHIPKIAITSVEVVNTIADRDALIDQEEGDVVKVLFNTTTNLPKTYIKTKTGWIEIESGSDVDTVNGYTGTVVLNASDIKMVSKPTTSVETELVSIADDVGHLVDLTGRPVDSVNLGTFTTTPSVVILTNNAETIKSAIDKLNTELVDTRDNVDDLISLSGVAENAKNLGTFTGVTISDSSTVKSALQQLENAHEDHLNDTVNAHKASAILVDPAVNGLTDVQSVLENHESRIDAIEAHAFYKEKFVLTNTDIANGYVTLARLAVWNSIVASVDRLMIHKDDDFTLSDVGLPTPTNTRITFIGSLITAGQEKLMAGDIVHVTYYL